MAWKKPLEPVENATGRREGILDKKQRDVLISKASTDIGAYLKGLSLMPFRPGALANLLVGNLDTKNGCLVIKLGKGKGERRKKNHTSPNNSCILYSPNKRQVAVCPTLYKG